MYFFTKVEMKLVVVKVVFLFVVCVANHKTFTNELTL